MGQPGPGTPHQQPGQPNHPQQNQPMAMMQRVTPMGMVMNGVGPGPSGQPGQPPHSVMGMHGTMQSQVGSGVWL